MECTTWPRRANSKNNSPSRPKKIRVASASEIATSPHFRKKERENHYVAGTFQLEVMSAPILHRETLNVTQNSLKREFAVPHLGRRSASAHNSAVRTLERFNREGSNSLTLSTGKVYGTKLLKTPPVSKIQPEQLSTDEQLRHACFGIDPGLV